MEEKQQPSESAMDFGTRLMELRKKAGMSQQQLADQIYVTRQAVSRWEQNKTQPDIATLQQLTQALQCSLQELVVGLDPDLPNQKRNLVWQKNTRYSFWISTAIQIGLLVYGVIQWDFLWILLPIMLFLCGGTLYPICNVMINGGDYTMLAGYDQKADYDPAKLERLVRAINLWVQYMNCTTSIIAIPLVLLSPDVGYVTIILMQVFGMLTVLLGVNYKYGRDVKRSANSKKS